MNTEKNRKRCATIIEKEIIVDLIISSEVANKA